MLDKQFKVIRKRDGGSYIVECDGMFYLVNPDSGICILANPPNMPDMFLKQGYFEACSNDDLSNEVFGEILQLLRDK
jgi:hypothetical protein